MPPLRSGATDCSAQSKRNPTPFFFRGGRAEENKNGTAQNVAASAFQLLHTLLPLLHQFLQLRQHVLQLPRRREKALLHMVCLCPFLVPGKTPFDLDLLLATDEQIAVLEHFVV